MNIRPATKEDIQEIYKLSYRNDYINEDITNSEYQKMYESLFFDNPPNKKYLLVAEDNNGIYASTGMVPFQFKFKEKNLIAGLGAKLIVDEPYRKGLTFFALKTKYLREYNKKQNIDFTYGIITRPGVLEAHIKLGYQEIGKLPVWARPYKSTSIIRKFFKSNLIGRIISPPLAILDLFLTTNFLPFPKIKDYSIEEISSFDKRFAKLFNDFNSQFSIVAKRSVENMNWRYNDLTFRRYVKFAVIKDNIPLGLIVLRKMPMKQFSTIALVDIITYKNDTEVIKILFNQLHKYALSKKVDLVSTAIKEESSYTIFLKRFGFFKSPEKFTIAIHTPKRSDLKIEASDYKDWHISWFDHDFV